MITTKSANDCLSEDMLHRLAAGECLPHEVSACEDHVSQCEYCRDLLESRAIDAQWHDQLLPALQLSNDDTVKFVDRDAAHQAALNLLGPTDDPHMLGRIGNYEVVAMVGIGGMGIVFKAFDAVLNRFVAIKMMQPHLAVSGAARQRFEREGRAAAAVINDFVLPIYAVSEWQGVPYLVMQYLAGMNLQKRLEAEGPLKVGEILRIAMQTARGLAAAHAQGLVHRDVKPSNILLDGSVDRAMLTDFGLARAVDDASVTRTGLLAGTPQYMSPEQVRGEKVDARSDLFSLGSTMYAMCTGHPPFRSETSYAVLHRIVDHTPRAVRDTNTDSPEWLERIVMKLLAKMPEERFESAQQVAELLEGCLAHVQHPTNSPLPEIVTNVAPHHGRRRPPIQKIIALTACMSFLLAGVMIVLELNKGTLTIECEADGVPIRVMQGDKLVEAMTVSREGKTTRIAAGKYTVEIDQPFDKAVVADGAVTISRGGAQVVKVQRSMSDEMTVVNHNVNDLLDAQSSTSVDQQLDTLVKLIRATINPDCWSSTQSAIAPFSQNKSIVVQQAPATQQAIAEFLDQLKKLKTDGQASKASPEPMRTAEAEKVGISLDSETGLIQIRGSQEDVKRVIAVMDQIGQQKANSLKSRTASNPFEKLFDAITAASAQPHPTRLPIKLIKDCLGGNSTSAGLSDAEKTFRLKSIQNIARSEQQDGNVVYNFDLDAVSFVQEILALTTGDATIGDDILNGFLHDSKGPQLDLRKIIDEQFGKQVKLTCNFHPDGTLGYLVDISLANQDAFMPSFQRYFECEPDYMANAKKDFYVLKTPSSTQNPSLRLGATVVNHHLFWGSLEMVEAVRDNN